MMALEFWGPREAETCAWCRVPLPEDCWGGRYCSRAHAAATVRTGHLRQPAASPRTQEPLRFIAVCWWCGGTYPTTTLKSRYCNTTHAGAAASARRKRRLREAARRARTGQPACPRPDKYAYSTLEIAVLVIASLRDQGRSDGQRMRAYWCACGQAHVGHLDEDRERRHSAPTNPQLRRERGLDTDSGWTT